MHNLSHYQHPHQWGHLLPVMNLHWHIIITQSPLFTLEVTSGFVHSVGLDICTVIWICPYGSIIEYFTALKTLCAPSMSFLAWYFDSWEGIPLPGLASSLLCTLICKPANPDPHPQPPLLSDCHTAEAAEDQVPDDEGQPLWPRACWHYSNWPILNLLMLPQPLLPV